MAVADDLQAVSVDEALLDVTNAVTNLKAQAQSLNTAVTLTHDYAKDLAEMLRSQIVEATQCQISIGIGSNPLLARFATKRAKPASSFHLHNVDAEEFLAPLPIDLIWGVGWSMRKKAEQKLSVRTVGELATKNKAVLIAVFGPKTGEMLWGAARGLSDQRIESSKKRKSVSAEINVSFEIAASRMRVQLTLLQFGIRFRDNGEAENFTRQLGKEVAKRLAAVNMRGRSLTLKVMKRHPEAPKEASKVMFVCQFCIFH
jgi:DNA repair protein REV1